MSLDAGDVARLSAVFKNGFNEDAINVFHCQLVDGAAIGDQAFMDVMRDRLELVYADLEDDISDEYAPVQLTGKVVIGGTQVLPDTAWTGGFAFTNITQALPPQVAALVFAGTNISKVQGRKYIFGLTEEDQSAGVWTATMIIELAKFGVLWIADFVVGGRTYRFGVVGGITPVFRQFTNSVVQGDSRTQRRRTLGRGS